MNDGIESTASVSCAASGDANRRWSELACRFSAAMSSPPACPGDGAAFVGSHAAGCSPSAVGCGIDR